MLHRHADVDLHASVVINRRQDGRLGDTVALTKRNVADHARHRRGGDAEYASSACCCESDRRPALSCARRSFGASWPARILLAHRADPSTTLRARCFFAAYAASPPWRHERTRATRLSLLIVASMSNITVPGLTRSPDCHANAGRNPSAGAESSTSAATDGADELAHLLNRLGLERDHLDGHRRHRAASTAGHPGGILATAATATAPLTATNTSAV